MSGRKGGTPDRRADERGGPQLAFDVTGLVTRADARPTGIERVMLEIALSLVQHESAAIEFCAFNPSARVFEHVSPAQVQELGSRMRGGAPGKSPAPEAAAELRSRSGRQILRRLLARSPSAAPHVRAAAGEFHAAGSDVAQSVEAVVAAVAASGRFPQLPGRSHPMAECCSTRWTTATTFCSVDPVFATEMLAHLSDRQSSAGFRIALMIHDLIPSLAPQYVTWSDDSAAIKTIQIADTIIVNSDATAQDVKDFTASHGLPLREVVKLPMASALRDLHPIHPPTQPGGFELTEGRFVLCVGSVTIRKNHQLLLDVWERLADSMGTSNAPALIVAGRLGWLCDETVSRLRHTPMLSGLVHHLTDASDENIAWLYEHCAFTAFPSLYEGWGLPVSESHDFGKVCLTSNRTSLPEAGEGLAELLDPTDRGLWFERILHYWNNTEARSAREELIGTRHRRITANDAADVILCAAGISDV